MNYLPRHLAMDCSTGIYQHLHLPSYKLLMILYWSSPTPKILRQILGPSDAALPSPDCLSRLHELTRSLRPAPYTAPVSALGPRSHGALAGPRPTGLRRPSSR